MSRQRTVGCLLVLILLCATSWGTTKDDIPFKLIRESVISVPVLVNGRGPFDFVFDTGTESSIIDSRLAGKLDISPVDRVVVFSPTGDKVLAKGFASEIEVGPVKILHSEMVFGELDSLHAINPHIRGILGQNVLSHFDYMIDYAHSMIEFESPTNSLKPINGTKTPLIRRHGCAILTGHPALGPDVHLVLDSGSSDLVLYSTKTADSASFTGAKLQTSSGPVETMTAVIPRIDVGNVTLRGLRTAFVKKNQVPEIDGLLPTRLFSAVYFNNREGYVMLRPR